ncbi:hypothetical protein [Vibrio coralliirubri]|uniref:hypothetical protein n=1 Tax=Vibrio coralliirubri TaxID=1516159 RepID=UPI00069CB059|nr:hypothetical protein [Vibrio coralliirubri]
MHKLTIIILSTIYLFGCGGGSSNSAESDVDKPVAPSLNIVSGTVLIKDEQNFNFSDLLPLSTKTLAVDNAIVYVDSTDRSYQTLTDSTGAFSVEVQGGTYELTVKKTFEDGTTYVYKNTIKADNESVYLSNIYLNKHAYFHDIKWYIDGVETTSTEFDVDDTIEIEAIGEDPNGLPLDYVFYRTRRCSSDFTIQDWSPLNATKYTFTDDDSVNCFGILMGVRNNDGIDADSEFLGDAQTNLSLTVNSDRSNAKIDDVQVFYNGYITNKRDFKAGDTVTLKALASDGNNSPLEYVFYRGRHHSLDFTIADWGNSNQITYTFEDEDSARGFGLWVGVRNNDGFDADSETFGDAQSSTDFTILGIYQHPEINSLDVYKNGQLYHDDVFVVGEKATIKINASDPNSRPLNYVFYRTRQCSSDTTLQDWSAVDSYEYTFEVEDTVNCFGLLVGVKNDDGFDADSDFLGDTQGAVSFTVVE